MRIRWIQFDMHYEYYSIPNIYEFQEILNKQNIACELQVAQKEEYIRLLCENGISVIFMEQCNGGLNETVIESTVHEPIVVEWNAV